MQPLQFLVPLDPLVAVEGLIPYAVLVLVVANMLTRFLAHRTHVQQARDGDDDELVTRYLPHTATTVLLILATFAYLVVHPHGGMVTAVLAIGLFLADFFEFEARRVEARNAMDVEPPKASVAASVLLLLYAAYQALFFVVAPVWNGIV